MAEEFPPPKYIDDVTCHEKWCETTQTLLGPPGTVKIEFSVYRWTPQVPVHIDRVSPVSRVTLSLPAAKGLHEQLTSTLQAIEQKVHLSQTVPPSPAKN